MWVKEMIQQLSGECRLRDADIAEEIVEAICSEFGDDVTIEEIRNSHFSGILEYPPGRQECQDSCEEIYGAAIQRWRSAR